MTARIGLKRSRLPLRPFCLSATPAKYLPNFLEVTTDPYKMTYDWESEDSLGLHAGAWELADDFDAPLPDEIWLGHDV